MASAGGRPSWQKDGECENFHRSAWALPATSSHAGHITCRYDTAGHSLTSRLCRVPGTTVDRKFFGKKRNFMLRWCRYSSLRNPLWTLHGTEGDNNALHHVESGAYPYIEFQ